MPNRARAAALFATGLALIAANCVNTLFAAIFGLKANLASYQLKLEAASITFAA